MPFSVSVDEGLCCAYGNCAMLCPEIFEVSNETQLVFIVVKEVPANQEESVREAIRDCPTGALSANEFPSSPK
jgi:ferredoxin